jgi:hypothetical protein
MNKKTKIEIKKTIKITDAGYTVLKIRKHHLVKIYEHDISFENK